MHLVLAMHARISVVISRRLLQMPSCLLLISQLCLLRLKHFLLFSLLEHLAQLVITFVLVVVITSLQDLVGDVLLAFAAEVFLLPV